MLRILNVQFKNFMSFGNVAEFVDLNVQQKALIIGENQDVGTAGESRNGAGKTTIFQAVVFSLFGKGVESKLKADQFVNFTNGKGLETSIMFEVNGLTYRVIRRRKPSDLVLQRVEQTEEKLEVVEDLTMDSMANTQDAITQLIGMTYDIFMTLFYLNPHNTPFLAKSASEQRATIETLLSIDLLSTRVDTLKKMRSDLEVDLKIGRRDIENADHQNQKIANAINDLEDKHENFVSQRQSQLDEINAVVTELESIDIEAFKAAHLRVDEITQKRKTITDTRDLMRSTIDNLTTRDWDREITSIQGAISRTVTAQADLDNFDTNCSVKREALEKSYQDVSGLTITVLESELAELTDIYSIVQKQINDVTLLEQKVTSHEQRVSDAKRRCDSVKSELDVLKSGKCPTCKQTHFDETLVTNKQVEFDKLTSELSSLCSELDTLKGELGALNSKVSESPQLGVVNEMITSVRTKIDRIRAYEREIESFERESQLQRDNLQQICDSSSYTQADIDQLIAERDKASAHYNDLQAKLSALDDELSSLNADESDIQMVSSMSRDMINDHAVNIAKLKAELDSLEKSSSPFLDEIERNKSMIVDVTQTIKDNEQAESKIKHSNILIKMLTDNKSFVRKALVSRFLPYLNKQINTHTESIGLNHTVVVNDDLSASIELRGRSYSFFNFSQGERLRADLAVTLAFRDLMKLVKTSTNLLMIDEYFDAAGDAYMVKRGMRLIEESDIENIMLITHREDLRDQMSKVITVCKSGDFSQIE